MTGGAAWMYLIGLEHILGVRPTLDGLRIDPCIPSAWPGYQVTRRWRGTTDDISVKNPSRLSRGVIRLTVDGVPVSGDTLPPAGRRQVKVEATVTRPH